MHAMAIMNHIFSRLLGFRRHATIEVANFVGNWRGSLTQNSLIFPLDFWIIFVVYLGHGIFRLVSVLFISKPTFVSDASSPPNVEES